MSSLTKDEITDLLVPERRDEWNAHRNSSSVEDLIFPRLNLERRDLRGFDLSALPLGRVNLHQANLAGANLNGADLHGADLSYSTLRGADLNSANLTGAFLKEADMRDTRLSDTQLCPGLGSHHFISRPPSFEGGACEGLKLAGAQISYALIHADLSTVEGLDQVLHAGPSYVTPESIRKCVDAIPEEFLRGCGWSNEEIAFYRARLGAIQFYSCFISYSSADEEFATRLHNDFQSQGIRCWKWDHDARTGTSLWGEIDQAIRVHDKLVLVASEPSLRSPAVNREIERAIQQEDDRQRVGRSGDVLFPVNLDNYIFEGWEHERKADVTKKVVADARGWDKDPERYAQVRNLLVRHLRSR